MISKFMSLSGVKESALAEAYIDRAKDQLLDYTNRKTFIPQMESLAVELALHLYETRDRADGVSARSEGAISETYIDTTGTGGLPPRIAARVERFRLLHAVKHHAG